MSKLNIYQTSWTDLVFENRNKEYGAYYLRQENNKTTLFAFLMGILLLTAASSIPIIYNYLNPDFETTTTIIPDSDPLILTKYDVYVPPVTEEQAPMPEVKNPITENPITNQQLTNPLIVHAAAATPDDIATNDELRNIPSDIVTNTAGTGSGTTASTGTSVAISTPTIPENTILTSNMVDKMPEFPGGIKKFYAYVGNNFERTEIETANAIRVSVSFVVEKDGSMTDIKVLKDPGYGLGAEAIRVLKSLKTKWSPGMYEGKPVRTSYNLPITIQPN